VDSPNLASYYSYDTLGNLIYIQQGKGSTLQHRYFKYDALSRLTYERQVEAAGTFTQSDSLTGNSSWSRKLVYDETIGSVAYKGLPTSMYDARNISAQFRYDQLNRITQVSYSDRTPTVTNNYDQAHTGYFNKGRLTEVITASVADDTGTGYDDSIPETRLNYDFDLMGRTVKSSQTVDSNVYNLSYKYNLGGQMTQETYPSGRVVNLGYDDASRLSNLNGGQGHVYADAFTYAGHGAISSFTMGNGATLSLGYGTNGRLQLSNLTLAKNGTTLQKYVYTYGQIEGGTLYTSKNNGQLAQVESWIGTEQQYQQQYSYDTLGRLTESIEKYGPGLASTAYDVKYRYDVFGNRQQRHDDNSGNPITLGQKWVEQGDISTETNRYLSGVTYDDAGNITADPRFRNLRYGYDADGRQNYAAEASGSGPVTAVFDGAGQRVANKAGGVVTIMVYDAAGKLVAEYGATAPTTANLQYVTADYQGSTRVVTNSSGAIANRRDYLPFGEEIGATVGSRTPGKGFGSGDMVRQKYAGMESDDATGMAHTLWRKQDNFSGRWTSPDPYGGSMSIADPQSFNRYTYCENDPVNKVDPLGLQSGADASQSWGDVAGTFWPVGFDLNASHFGGPGSISDAEADHDLMVSEDRALKAYHDAIEKGDLDEVRRILKENPSIGYESSYTEVIVTVLDSPFVNTQERWAHWELLTNGADELWDAHPSTHGDSCPCKSLTIGECQPYNQCAVRMSAALQNFGVDMSDFQGATCGIGGHDGHYTNAEQLSKYITKHLGAPKSFKDGNAALSYMKDKKGIVFSRQFIGVQDSSRRWNHIDVWNGNSMAGGFREYITNSPKEVLFWQLK
jgi:RHS repeat-associated protein